MTYEWVALSDFMRTETDIDSGIMCCEACGALVPFDRISRHDAFHAKLRDAEDAADPGSRKFVFPSELAEYLSKHEDADPGTPVPLGEVSREFVFPSELAEYLSKHDPRDNKERDNNG